VLLYEIGQSRGAALAVILFLVAPALFRLGVKRYNSASS
jgi:ABC-type uncharacterized transport system permease subunit